MPCRHLLPTSCAQVKPSLRKIGVNVLGTASRKESLVLALRDLREALGGQLLTAEQVGVHLPRAKARDVVF